MRATLQKILSVLTALSLVAMLLPSSHAAPEESAADVITVSSFLDTQEALQQAGYPQEDLAVLYANLSVQTLIRLSQQALIPGLADYAALDYFHEDRIERYAAYAALHPDYSPEDVVTFVNIGLDQSRYSVYDQIVDPGALDVLVNQYHFLGDNYVPELVRMSSDYTQASNDYLRPEAYQWFIRMANAARHQGLTLRSVSAYRSYATQKSLYARYVSQDGVAAADRYSARPGFSEHQTGLALDINVVGSRYHFETSAEYQWLIENCWDYGFILRYPEDSTHITGYIYEPWHYRYVGIELAQQIRASGLTYDEFLARQPAEKSGMLPNLTFLVDGIPATIFSPIYLNGELYLSVNEVAAAFNWSCRWVGERLKITAPHRQFSLPSPNSSIAHRFIIRQEQIYMKLSDLVQALQLSCWQVDHCILLSSVQAVEGWPFTDVLPYDQWYEAACFVWQEGLFAGTGTDTFSPDLTMTRGMAVTVLQKLDPENTPVQAPAFPDVPDHAWYAVGVSWACSTGVVTGYPNGLFCPDQNLTRQEAAVILYQFARHMGCSTWYYSLPLSVKDANQVADWALAAMSWAYQNQLLLLREDGTLAYDAPISRAEMAHAMMHLCQNLP